MLNEASSRWFLFFRESRGVRSDAFFFSGKTSMISPIIRDRPGSEIFVSEHRLEELKCNTANLLALSV